MQIGNIIKLFHEKEYGSIKTRNGDEALFHNMEGIIQKEKAKVALISTGGFHSEGIRQRLKEKNIPYLLISPKIHELGDKSIYLNVMEGKRSYMKYFNGSLWDALAQDYAAKLAASLNHEDLTPSLKRWRDRIIQNSMAEGRITQATQYTKYVDALVQALRKEYEKQGTWDMGQGTGSKGGGMSEEKLKEALSQELNSFMDTYFNSLQSLLKQRINTLGEGLKEMIREKDFSPKAIETLINRMNHPGTSNLATALALIPEHRETILSVARQIGLTQEAIETKAEELQAYSKKASLKT